MTTEQTGPPTIKGTEVHMEDGWRVETPIENNNAPLTYSTDTKRQLHNLKGKYIKHLLSKLEELNVLDIIVRKIVLDALNDYAREVNKELGYDE